MKIEKKRLSENSKWNSATKAGLAALMGIAASTAFVACEDSQSASSQSNPEPLGGDVAAPDIYPEDSSSSLNNTNNSSSSEINSPILSSSQTSSSNQVVVDIPKSSSSYNVDEILSSIVNPTQNSSSEAASSSDAPASSSSEAASSSENLSSSSNNPTSSSVNQSSSSNNGFDSPANGFNSWEQDSSYRSNIFLCPDSERECMMGSMVTTFESTDIDV